MRSTFAGNHVVRGLRREEAVAQSKGQEEMDKPSYVVFDDKTLLGRRRRRPASIDELERVKGVGRGKKLQDYGNEVLDIGQARDGATGGARGGPASTSTLASAWAKAGGAPRRVRKETTTPTPFANGARVRVQEETLRRRVCVTEMSSERLASTTTRR